MDVLESLQSVRQFVLASPAPWVIGLISTFLAWLATQRKTFTENVTRERAEWRKDIRTKAKEVCDVMIREDQKDTRQRDLHKLQNEFRALLNLMDRNDQGIIESIRLPCSGNEREHAQSFMKRISLLLKHDWQRSIDEAKLLLFWLARLRRRKSYVWLLKHERVDACKLEDMKRKCEISETEFNQAKKPLLTGRHSKS